MLETIDRIREAKPTTDEVLAIARVVSACRLSAYDLTPGTQAYRHMVEEPLTDEKLTELTEWVSRPHGLAWVAETSEGNIGGIAIGQRDEPKQTDRFEYFFMDPRFQGQGWGSEMIRTFCSRAVYPQLVWLVYGNDRAEQLYAKHGFQWFRTYRDRAIEMKFKGMERPK